MQGKVLGAILAKVHGLGDGVGGLDAATRYYVMARFSYGYADVEFDEANNLARSAGIELGNGLSRGPRAAGQDHQEGGAPARLRGARRGPRARARRRAARSTSCTACCGAPTTGAPRCARYLDQTRPDPQRLRLVAQALQGRALRGENETKPAEAQACERLLGAWRTLVEENLFTR